ncbi:uncharacterized protein METZ01_LOCUS193369 [marine metagenome]|uniref:Uncharacterized protein n=1 Tax=marine metagenome TaxID=408172 RepID=A0A382DQM9_9ZZZZ
MAKIRIEVQPRQWDERETHVRSAGVVGDMSSQELGQSWGVPEHIFAAAPPPCAVVDDPKIIKCLLLRQGSPFLRAKFKIDQGHATAI